jgi:hypothetical protein
LEHENRRKIPLRKTMIQGGINMRGKVTLKRGITWEKLRRGLEI